MATISEINGDVGARGSCVLYVDGAEADRADGIWVDAGDVVSCLFTHSFAVGGTHALVVGVEDVVPADDNPDNNSVSGSIEIVSGKPLSSYAYARDEQVDQTFTQYYSFAKADDSEGSESQDQFTDFHQVSQQSYISAWTEDLLSFPLTRVEISASKGGTTVFSMALEDLPADWTDAGPTYVQSCATRWDPSGYMELCTYQSGATTQSWVYGSQSAGVVTYFATGYSHSWNLATGEDTYYDYTDNCPGCSASGTVAPFGADVAWTVDLNDGGSRYHASPTIIMGGPRDDSWNDPWSCAEYLFGDWVYKTCGESQGSSRTAEGVASEP